MGVRLVMMELRSKTTFVEHKSEVGPKKGIKFSKTEQLGNSYSLSNQKLGYIGSKQDKERFKQIFTLLSKKSDREK